MRIAAIEVAEARFALPTPLLLGGREVGFREYTFVSVTDEDGVQGCAYGLTRGLPVAHTIARLIGPLLLGGVGQSPRELLAPVSSALSAIRGDSCLQRGLSLVDIALWDAIAAAGGMPVWQALGGLGDSQQPNVISVDGYVTAGSSDEEMAEVVERRTRDGIAFIKFAGEADFASLRDRVESALDAAVGPLQVIVDMLWTVTTFTAARELSKALGHLPIAWIEDPSPAGMMLRSDAIRRGFSPPVGFGDEVSDENLLYELMSRGRLDVLRLDATTIGGLSGATEVARWARQRGLAVSPHICPEIHQHLCFSAAGAQFLEFFPADGRYDCSDQYLAEPLIPENGTVPRPTDTGLGLRLDWPRILTQSSYHESLSARA